jgi:hypothetical protein
MSSSHFSLCNSVSHFKRDNIALITQNCIKNLNFKEHKIQSYESAN